MITFRARHKTGFWVNAPIEPFTFPAGEAHLKIDESFAWKDHTHFIADVRGHSAQDLFHLALWHDAMISLNLSAKLTVFLPYLPAARADRGVPFGAEVYYTFLSQMLDQASFVTLDPHSPVMPGFWEKAPVNVLSIYPVEHIIGREVGLNRLLNIDHDYTGVIAPDKGAHDRASKAAYAMHLPVYTAGKTRDFETGKLTGFHMEDELPAEGKFLIVDDICDGGGTFVGLAEAIKQTNPNVVLDLWVTHGVFSKPLMDLAKAFQTIHTTNSYYDRSQANEFEDMLLRNGKLVVHDITPYLYEEIAFNDR